MKTETARFFIGFTTLEDLLKNFSSAEIFITAMTQSRTGQYGVRLTDWFVRVAALSGERCYYWQMQTGASQSVGGNPMGDGQENCRKRTFDFLDLLKAEIAARLPEICIIEASVSFSVNSEVLHGSTELFCYDKQSDSYKKATRTAD